ncbi:sialidase-1 [Fusarium langsethiae]|uniref:Sialidase-1 n=1 Tax=Fusarium langsethiae TaxID=179993 RepID=A0A0M9EQ22_FUSLA|nr:sialidase-1 [Fusarium langsethiae]GKU06886.1 unnamed protein product [Fusarium langsethiae]GKU20860.1 unnamed protein product [Fusarium langsethiae]
MKPVFALTICLGLLEGADAIAVPGFVSPKVGYSTPLSHGEKKAAPANPAVESGPDADSSPRVFGAYTPKSKLVDLPPVRRSDEAGDGSDDDFQDDSGDDTTDTPEDSPDSDDSEVVYPEPMMAPAYVRTGALPVDKPQAAPKAKSSKKVDIKTKSKSGSKSSDDTVHTAKHGGDDDSESGSSGKKKQKGKDKNKGSDDNPGKHSGDDDASKSRTKTEGSTSTSASTSATSTSTISTSVTPRPTSGRHSGDDDDKKSRTKTEDSPRSGSPKPTSPPDDSSKGSGKGKGKGKDFSGKHTGDDDATKSSSKKGSRDDSAKADDSKSKSAKPASKKSSDSPRHPRALTSTHQSGTTFDPNSAKGGGKNGPGYYKPFDPPKLNSGYIQAVPPKASQKSSKSSPKVKPKPQLNTRVSGPLSSLRKRENLLSLRAAAPLESVTIDRAKWKVTCDSVHEGNECQNAIDGKADTFWHTQWEGSEPAPPHMITVDMRKVYNVFLSKDNKNWGSPVAYGTWYADYTAKYANFDTQPARYVRIFAITEANCNPWTSIAELNVFQGDEYMPPQPSALGAWGPTVNFPVIPVAGTVDPKTGKVLVWSSWARDTMDGGPGGLTLTSMWDPATGLVSEREVTETNHDMFCPGISLDGNGELVVTGGNNAERTSLFDPVKQDWIPGPDMKVARGYQSSATTSIGKVFTIGGSWSGGEYFKNGEVYDPKKKTWTLLNKADVQKMLTDDAQGLFRSDNHAWLFGWKKGTVFQAGPSKAMNWYYTDGKDGNVKTAGQRKSDRGVAPDAMCGNTIMFDAVKGKILTNGGTPNYQDSDATADAHIITINNPGNKAAVSYASEGLFHARVFHSSVVLPNGNVFITGGQQYAIPFADTTPVLEPEIYLPDEDRFVLMKPNNIVRTYHSIALLLPDGRVFNGGGGLCGGCDTNHFDAQLYTPPYLYNSKGKLAARPKIASVSASTVKVGGTVTVQTSGSVAQASLVRYGSATHTVNSDQRRIPLTLSDAGKNTYSFQVPSDPGIALPGYWMLFVMDKNGVPSVASTIKVTG